jgi:hypothetical protein
VLRQINKSESKAARMIAAPVNAGPPTLSDQSSLKTGAMEENHGRMGDEGKA